jgi:hypothetical protein
VQWVGEVLRWLLPGQNGCILYPPPVRVTSVLGGHYPTTGISQPQQWMGYVLSAAATESVAVGARALGVAARNGQY